MPGLPLFALTCPNAAFRLSCWHTSSIKNLVDARLSFSSFRHGRFRPFARRARGFTLCRLREGQETLDIPLLFAHESRELLTFPFTSLLERGTVRALSPLSEAYYALG